MKAARADAGIHADASIKRLEQYRDASNFGRYADSWGKPGKKGTAEGVL